MITYSLSPKVSKWIYIRITVVLIIIHIGLIQYFHSALVPLGADLYIYSWADIKQSVGAAGSINLSAILFFIIFVLLLSKIIFVSLMTEAPVLPINLTSVPGLNASLRMPLFLF